MLLATTKPSSMTLMFGNPMQMMHSASSNTVAYKCIYLPKRSWTTSALVASSVDEKLSTSIKSSYRDGHSCIYSIPLVNGGHATGSNHSEVAPKPS